MSAPAKMNELQINILYASADSNRLRRVEYETKFIQEEEDYSIFLIIYNFRKVESKLILDTYILILDTVALRYGWTG